MLCLCQCGLCFGIILILICSINAYRIETENATAIRKEKHSVSITWLTYKDGKYDIEKIICGKAKVAPRNVSGYNLPYVRGDSTEFEVKKSDKDMPYPGPGELKPTLQKGTPTRYTINITNLSVNDEFTETFQCMARWCTDDFCSPSQWKPANLSLIVKPFDPCTYYKPTCDPQATCHNLNNTSAQCVCNAGYTGNGTACTDIDECTSNTTCHLNATCHNNPGSYACKCIDGFSGNGKTCTNINECMNIANTNCHQHAKCEDNIGSYDCACKEGWNGDGRNCEDINECNATFHSCHYNSTCHNTIGSYGCTCNDGYEGTGFNCSNTKECLNSTRNNCHLHATCTDTMGSFSCACNRGWTGNGTHCVALPHRIEAKQPFININATRSPTNLTWLVYDGSMDQVKEIFCGKAEVSSRLETNKNLPYAKGNADTFNKIGEIGKELIRYPRKGIMTTSLDYENCSLCSTHPCPMCPNKYTITISQVSEMDSDVFQCKLRWYIDGQQITQRLQSANINLTVTGTLPPPTTSIVPTSTYFVTASSSVILTTQLPSHAPTGLNRYELVGLILAGILGLACISMMLVGLGNCKHNHKIDAVGEHMCTLPNTNPREIYKMRQGCNESVESIKLSNLGFKPDYKLLPKVQ